MSALSIESDSLACIFGERFVGTLGIIIFIFFGCKMLSKEEMEKLENLSALELSLEEKDKLNSQLGNIIQFLDKLKNFELDGDLSQIDQKKLDMLEGVREFDDSKSLLQNVKHEIVNNSIVVKSVL